MPPPPMHITPERPDSPAAIALISELDDHLSSRYAAENRHGFSVEKLLRQGVEFFIIWADSAHTQPAGCGGLLFVPPSPPHPAFAELKRMYTRPAFRGLGFGRAMLNHLIAHAHARDFQILRLETGIHQLEARALYESCGFREIGHFPPYHPDPISAFYERNVQSS